MVFSNIADCDTVLAVYDYSNPAQISQVTKATAAQLGWNGSGYAHTCDPTYQRGQPPAPHGCATSKISGKAYCNLTSSGELVAIDIDATAPGYTRIATHGSGAGYTKAHPDGRYIYSLQGEPREGSGGATCQVGQLVVLDAQTDTVVNELPLLYKGPACADAINCGDEETTEPSHMLITHDKNTLFVTVAGGFGVATARVRQQLAVDITSPATPVQLASIGIGTSTGYHGDGLSGDGKWLLVANNLENGDAD